MRARDFLLTEGYYDVEKDKHNVALIDDTRRPRFTLEHLNTLRKVREFRNYEKTEDDEEKIQSVHVNSPIKIMNVPVHIHKMAEVLHDRDNSPQRFAT